METIFSKILRKEIPAHVVYEDDIVLAFLDVKPNNKGHTLVIPKKGFVDIFDGDDEVLGHMMKVAKKIALALRASGLAEGVNLIMNNGEESGQVVFHAHLHVIPRLKGDNVFQPPTHVSCTTEDLALIKEQIKEKLM